MQLTKESIEALRRRLVEVREQGKLHFSQTAPRAVMDKVWPYKEYWEIEDPEHLQCCEELRQNLKKLSVDIAASARISPLLADADMQELRHNTRQMLSNLYYREYRHTGVYVHHDEGLVLGVDPPTHEEVPFESASYAPRRFDEAMAKTLDIVDLLLPSGSADLAKTGVSSYLPNSAFVMMAIDESKPELEDIKTAIKDTFHAFGIEAVVADEIEHEGAITDKVLSEIESSEFLIADLTHERPNVYYEIGYAHAIKKRVILVRKKGTKLHFDIAHRNCPEYKNTTALKDLLRKRLEAVTNRKDPARKS